MSLWLNTYLRAIEERDSKEKANESLFNTCVLTKLGQHLGGQLIDEITQIRGWQTEQLVLLLQNQNQNQNQRL